ncbi:hypothetical protein HY988_05970 [Candidatus Micrarchaeota archaeon]|nr:hypothetical protein [Candidatus Micrarchaeota archaeon]
MFVPKKMRKVRIIVLKAEVEKLIKDLHEIGLVQISKIRYEGLDEGRPLPAFDELSAYLGKLRAIFAIMEQELGKAAMQNTEETKLLEPYEAIAQVKTLNTAIENRIKSLTKQIEDDSSLLKDLGAKADFVKKLLAFEEIDFSKLKSRTLDYRLGKCQNLQSLLLLKQKAAKVDDTTVLSKAGTENTLIVFRAKNHAAIDSMLAESGFSAIDLDSSITSPAETHAKINSQIVEAKSRIANANSELKTISKQYAAQVKLLISSLEVGTARAEISSKFANSKSLYIIQGWIVDENYDKLAKVVEQYHTSATLESMKMNHEDHPPIVFNNPKISSPFQFLTKNYSLPNYFEIDPTMAYFIALPIIYGMIVGDVLYGILSIFIAQWFLKKFEKSEIMRNVSLIWFYSAFPTILFGIIFDEWGGLSHLHLAELITKWTGIELLHAPLYSGLHRIENVITLVEITVVVGLIHLALGFLFGAINEWNHNRKHSIGKLAWIGLEIGAILALSAAIAHTSFLIPGLVFIVGSIIVIGATEGIIGIIEIPGLVGNVLSYARIAAIGIVGVVIAELLNEFLVPLPEQGFMAILLIPLFIGLHILNCFIAMFESLIQGGRLNIVEFRSKFMHGGNSLFSPFAMISSKNLSVLE